MWIRAFFALAGLALLATPASAVTIDWVLVGDPGASPRRRPAWPRCAATTLRAARKSNAMVSR